MPVPALKSDSPEQQPYRKRAQGFTLIELLVVVTVIVIVAAIAIPAYNSYINKAKRTIAYSTLDTIRKALETYSFDYQVYPPAPIDFSNGTDNMGRTVFSSVLVLQINKDITPVKYNSATNTYTLIAKAKNSEQTIMTLTPQKITY